MGNHNSNTHFALMAFGFFFRDLLVPGEKVLKEAGIKRGYHVLDYGCGPGSYILPLSERAGKEGFVHALESPGDVLKEIHRILKPEGMLSFSDHHMRNEEIIKAISDNGLFKYSHQGKKTSLLLELAKPIYSKGLSITHESGR